MLAGAAADREHGDPGQRRPRRAASGRDLPLPAGRGQRQRRDYGEDETLQTLALEPSLQSESVSGADADLGDADASINPNDQETTYHFEYGPTTAYGTVLPAPDASVGSGYGDVVVGQQLTGLQPGTTYHFRVIATNATSPPGGTVGPDQTFTTPPLQPPVVSTGQAVGVAQNTATLTGTIDTQGFRRTTSSTSGPTRATAPGSSGTPAPNRACRRSRSRCRVSMPGTTYHYRIAATNTFGTVYGADVTFTTGTYPSAMLTEPVTPRSSPRCCSPPRGAPRGRPRPRAQARRSHGATRQGREEQREEDRQARTEGPPRGAGHAHGANRREG